MKLAELKQLDVAALKQELSGLMRARFNLRVQLATQQTTNTAQVRQLRRQVAQTLTLLRQKGERV